MRSDEIIPVNKKRRIFFICEPIIAGFWIFPLLIIFWQSGWNFMVNWFDSHVNQPFILLFALYLLSQALLLFIYINQDRLYHFLVRQESKYFTSIILQLHSFLTAVNYVIQWVTTWTLWDRYTSDDWWIMLLFSIIAILSMIVLTGHPCDLVCAPFIISYDSIEYNVRIGTPFNTEKMNQSLAHILNYIFYEHIISVLSISAWHGLYGIFDVFLYPNNEKMSACISLLVGYILFFLLMYTQSFLNKICLPKFIETNYPLLIQNLRHLCAFVSCVLLWRGFWILFDLYIATISFAQAYSYVFYLICIIVSFIILSIMKTGSSINGPMSHMHDEYNLFPLYPNCFLIKWFNRKKISNEILSKSNEITINEPFTITVL